MWSNVKLFLVAILGNFLPWKSKEYPFSVVLFVTFFKSLLWTFIMYVLLWSVIRRSVYTTLHTDIIVKVVTYNCPPAYSLSFLFFSFLIFWVNSIPNHLFWLLHHSCIKFYIHIIRLIFFHGNSALFFKRSPALPPPR